MTNSSPYHDLAPNPTQAGRIRMIHHGGATPSRNIELMIEVMDYLDERFHLDLMLVASDPRYCERLARLAQKRPHVSMVPTMPMRELPVQLNKYDVGLYLLPPNSFNNQYALPNKFFEFIQARLAVAIGPSPEMARLVRHYECGIVSEDFTPRSLADRLRKLDADEIDHFKRRSHLAARELSFEKDAEVLLTTINGLTGNR
jgi:glycosyltransferase involved in cell wall biosynthesis